MTPRNPFEPMTIANVGDGRAAELFEAALVDLQLDLEDGDKQANAKRTFTLTVEFLPGKKPDEPLRVVVGGKFKAAPRLPRETWASRTPSGGFVQFRNIQPELPYPPLLERIESPAPETAGGDDDQESAGQ